MPEIFEDGIPFDVIKMNRLRVQAKVTQVLCEAFIHSNKSFSDLSNEMGKSEEELWDFIKNPDMDDISDITLAIDKDINFELFKKEGIQPQTNTKIDELITFLIDCVNKEKDIQVVGAWIRENFPDLSKHIK